MLIESLIKRAEGTYVTMGKDVYHFFNHVKGDPRHLCEVEDVDHAQAFLVIKEGYRIAKPLKKAKDEPEAAKVDPVVDAANKAAADAAAKAAEKDAANKAAAAKEAEAKSAADAAAKASKA